jgi:4-hydroxybenzoate polyprenyltransferase
MKNIRSYFRLVKFSHTVFGLPYAIIGLLYGLTVAEKLPSYTILIPVILCVVFARNAAMSFNRWADRYIDEANPRTKSREIPARIISPASVFVFFSVNALLFVVSSWFINTICFYLSPLALIIICIYSYSKRYTYYSHFLLGLALMIAPVGAFMAVTAKLDISIIVLGLSVLFWVAGFDIIYAMQDLEFDRTKHLHSVPVRFGEKKSMKISLASHIVSLGLLFFWIFVFLETNMYVNIGLILYSILILRQHIVVRNDSKRNLNHVFLFHNGIGSLLLCAFLTMHFLML